MFGTHHRRCGLCVANHSHGIDLADDHSKFNKMCLNKKKIPFIGIDQKKIIQKMSNIGIGSIFRSTPHQATVTARIMTRLVGNP